MKSDHFVNLRFVRFLNFFSWGSLDMLTLPGWVTVFSSVEKKSWKIISMFHKCYGLNVCSPPPNSCIEILTPRVMVRRWGLWEVSRSWGWELYEWDYYPCKRNPRDLPSSLFAMWGYNEKTAVWQYAMQKRDLTRTWPCWRHDFRPPAFRTVRNNFCCL